MYVQQVQLIAQYAKKSCNETVKKLFPLTSHASATAPEEVAAVVVCVMKFKIQTPCLVFSTKIRGFSKFASHGL